MDPDNWTPARGWGIAMLKAGYRCAAIFLVVGVADFLAFHLTFLPVHWAVMAVLFLASAAVGYPVGHLLCRKLVDDCGLAGRTIVLPVVVLLAVAEFAALQVVVALKGGAATIPVVVALGIAMWSLLPVAKELLFD
jgi:hypothetical protein